MNFELFEVSPRQLLAATSFFPLIQSKFHCFSCHLQLPGQLIFITIGLARNFFSFNLIMIRCVGVVRCITALNIATDLRQGRKKQFFGATQT